MNKTIVKFAIALIAAIALVAPFTFAVDGLYGLKADGSVANGKVGLANKIIGVIQFVGVAIALGMLIVIGIKYITAAPEGKAEIKGTAINYLFGAICIFAATAILSGIASLATSVSNG